MDNNMKHFETFLKVMDAFAKAGVEYILIGGYAVIIYGLPRFTQDVDIYVRMEEENVNCLRAALDSVFHDESLQEITIAEIIQYPVIRYGSPDGFLIDIIGSLGESSTYDDISFEAIEIEGHIVRVATPESLYRLKHDTVRPQDRYDAEFLKQLIEKRLASKG
jgi:hypothetical protein